MSNKVREAFIRVKSDIAELRVDVMKLADRINELAIEVKAQNKKRR